MDVLSTFQRSNKDSVHLFRRNKPVHFGGSLDFLYCMIPEGGEHFDNNAPPSVFWCLLVYVN